MAVGKSSPNYIRIRVVKRHRAFFRIALLCFVFCHYLASILFLPFSTVRFLFGINLNDIHLRRTFLSTQIMLKQNKLDSTSFLFDCRNGLSYGTKKHLPAVIMMRSLSQYTGWSRKFEGSWISLFSDAIEPFSLHGSSLLLKKR